MNNLEKYYKARLSVICLIMKFGDTGAAHNQLLCFLLMPGIMEVHQTMKQNTKVEQYQRLEPLSAVFQTLCHLLAPGFGPNGLKILLTTSTGKVLITNSGCQILKSLSLAHPLGKLLSSTALALQNETGDYSKTFILLLAALMSRTSSHVDFKTNSQDANIATRSSLRIAFHRLRTHVLPQVLLPEMATQFSSISICNENREAIFEVMTNLVRTSLSSKHSPITSSHLADVLIELLASFCPDINCLRSAITSCADLFQLLCAEVVGEHPTSSKAVNGFLIQKDFLFASASLSNMLEIRFVIWHSSADESEEETALPKFAVGSRADLVQALQWKTSSNRVFVQLLQSLSVSLLLSCGQIDDLMNSLCSSADISTVQFVSEEEVARISLMAKIHPVFTVSDLSLQDSHGHIGIVQSCKTTVLGGRRFIHMEGVRPASLHVASQQPAERYIIVCGPSMGVCQEMKVDLYNSLKVIKMWLSCDWMQTDIDKTSSPLNCERSGSSCTNYTGLSLPGGGTFEMLLYTSLKKLLLPNSKHCLNGSVKFACKALQEAVLEIPVSLLMNSYNHSSGSVAAVLNLIETSLAHCGRVAGINGRTGEQLLLDSYVTEPVEGKVRVLLTVLSLMEQILSLEMTVSARKLDNVCHDDSASDEE